MSQRPLFPRCDHWSRHPSPWPQMDGPRWMSIMRLKNIPILFEYYIIDLINYSKFTFSKWKSWEILIWVWGKTDSPTCLCADSCFHGVCQTRVSQIWCMKRETDLQRRLWASFMETNTLFRGCSCCRLRSEVDAKNSREAESNIVTEDAQEIADCWC